MGPVGFAGHEPAGERGVVWPKGMVPAAPTATPPTNVVAFAPWNWHWNRPLSSAFFGACWQYCTDSLVGYVSQNIMRRVVNEVRCMTYRVARLLGKDLGKLDHVRIIVQRLGERDHGVRRVLLVARSSGGEQGGEGSNRDVAALVRATSCVL